jgi:hypothetical protein
VGNKLDQSCDDRKRTQEQRFQRLDACEPEESGDGDQRHVEQDTAETILGQRSPIKRRRLELWTLRIMSYAHIKFQSAHTHALWSDSCDFPAAWLARIETRGEEIDTSGWDQSRI